MGVLKIEQTEKGWAYRYNLDARGLRKITQTPEILLRCSVVNRDCTLFHFWKKVNPRKFEPVADKNVCNWKCASIQRDLMHRISAAASAEKSYVPKMGMQIYLNWADLAGG